MILSRLRTSYHVLLLLPTDCFSISLCTKLQTRAIDVENVVIIIDNTNPLATKVVGVSLLKQMTNNTCVLATND